LAPPFIYDEDNVAELIAKLGATLVRTGLQ
jgi:hypothetical protein